MQLDPKAHGMDPVLASSFFAAIDMFSKEVFDQKVPVFKVDYGARLFTLINGVKTNLIAVSTQRLNKESIETLDSLLAEFELDWLEIVNPFDYNYDTSFVDVYLDSFGERVMQKLSFRSLPDSWVPYFTIKPDSVTTNSIIVGLIDGFRNIKEIIEVSKLSRREIVLEMSRLWAHRVIRFRNMLNFNDFMSARTKLLRYTQATSEETQTLQVHHPEIFGVIPRLSGLIDGRLTVREILIELRGQHDEREVLRALDYLLENGAIEALSPEKRRILLVKEALDLSLRVAEQVYSQSDVTAALRSVMNKSSTPETLGQLRLKDDRWSVDYDFKILEEIDNKRVMLLYGEWMKILAEFVATLDQELLDLYISSLTKSFTQRIVSRFSAHDMRGFEEFAYWLEILYTPNRPQVEFINTQDLSPTCDDVMEELAYILLTRSRIIYNLEGIGQLTSVDDMLDALPPEWIADDKGETFQRVMIEYGKLGSAAQLTLLILSTQRGINLNKNKYF